MTAPLTDQPARDRIATSFRETLFVEAGAGTGKTSALVGRIVGLVKDGVELQQIAAITFTEAAAAELRDRIRGEFEKAVREGGAGAEACREALRQVDIASISTLHSFAQRILALYPLEAGLPPRIEILDDVRGRMQFEERWRELLETLLSDDSHGLPIAEVLELGLTVEHLREIALELHDRWDRLDSFTFPAGEPALDLADVLAALDELREQQACCIDDSDRLLPFVTEVLEFGAELRARETDAARLEQLMGFAPKSPGSVGRAAAWAGVTPKEVRDTRRAVVEACSRAIVAYRTAHLLPLLERLRKFVLEYAAERRRRGTLEFHDLLVLARDLLRDNDAVRRAVGSRYRAILIDEFQDTDPIQLEIAALLATDDDAVTGRSWQELRIGAGRLFFVGDPKQAIYRFRGADIALYRRARTGFGASEVLLQQNFRTVRRIVHWVNAMFDSVIAEGAGDAQPRYVPLEPSRDDVSAALPVAVLGGPRDDTANVDELRRIEARDLVAAMRTVKAQQWMVVDRATKEQRPARYGDIAVLLPARTTLPWLERELEAQSVPYRIVSRALLYRTQEVRDLTNILAAIDDPADQVALVAALRSPAFACRDDQLHEWTRAGGRWDYRRATPAGIAEDHPVAAALCDLRELHERRWWLDLNELVETVIRERKMFELAYAFRRPRERWQRLRFVLDQARAFTDMGGTTLREFVAWLREQAEQDVMVNDTVVARDDDDAVQIMTIHASKGLEFPVVVLAGLNVGDQPVRSRVLWGDAGAPEVRSGNQQTRFETAGFEALSEREKAYSSYERRRLLYVGATRARDHLIVSLYHRGRSERTPAVLLWAVCQQHPELWREFPLPAAGLPAEERTAEVLQCDDLEETAWAEQREQRVAKATASAVRAATEIARTGEEDDAELERTWRRGRAATNIGRAVHATLQAIDLATGDGLDAAAKAQAAAEGIPWAADRVASLARAALRAPAIREAVQGGRYWREVYVGAPVGETVVEGFIDLLYDTPDGLVVVDYKTDSVDSEEEIAAVMERYRLQGAVYALALRQLAGRLGRPIARCTFVFLRGGEPRERHVTDLPAAIAEVEARLAVPNERLA